MNEVLPEPKIIKMTSESYENMLARQVRDKKLIETQKEYIAELRSDLDAFREALAMHIHSWQHTVSHHIWEECSQGPWFERAERMAEYVKKLQKNRNERE
jgi:hypothetical protein